MSQQESLYSAPTSELPSGERRARPTKTHQGGRRRYLGAWRGGDIRHNKGTGGYGDHAVRERGTAARQVSAEAPDDRADQPSAPARDAILGVRRRRHHAE